MKDIAQMTIEELREELRRKYGDEWISRAFDANDIINEDKILITFFEKISLMNNGSE